MNTTFDHRLLWSPDGLPRADGSALIAAARALRLGAASGANASLLRGKQIALMCDGATAADPAGSDDAASVAALLCDASQALGATVTRLQYRSDAKDGSHGLTDIAHLLGRMYDAVDCAGLTFDAAAEIERLAGVPVFNGLTGPGHLAGVLARQMTLEDGATLPAGRHRGAPGPATTGNHLYIVQAILLATLG